jgi:hypothetical protein
MRVSALVRSLAILGLARSFIGQRPFRSDDCEHSEPAGAPRTHKPRDVPRCGALSLLLAIPLASPVLERGAQADARGAGQVLDRGADAAARGATPRASQELYRGAQAVASCAARCLSQVIDRGAQVVASGAARCASQVLARGAWVDARGAATQSQQEKGNSEDVQRSGVNVTG